MTYDWREVPLFVEAKPHLTDVDALIDVGPGLRPQSLVRAKSVICIEPHGEYADALEEAGFKVIREAAPDALGAFWDGPAVDTVMMLDVVEHMEKADGVDSIRRACTIARRQVVVFTPLGFLPQSGGEEADPWGMQGQHWQQHRSGWTPADFPGWLHLIDENFAPKHPAFLAIWDRPR